MILRVERLRVKRGGRVVLEDLELEADAGEIVGVVGKNGCGKSTLLMTIAGVLAPSDGRVLIDGASVWGVARDRVRANRPECPIELAYLDFMQPTLEEAVVALKLMTAEQFRAAVVPEDMVGPSVEV